MIWPHSNNDVEGLAATEKYPRFTDFIRGGWNILCHNFSQIRSGSRERRFPVLGSVKIPINLLHMPRECLNSLQGRIF